MTTDRPHVEAIDYHRNGSGDIRGFYSAIITDTIDGTAHRMLVNFSLDEVYADGGGVRSRDLSIDEVDCSHVTSVSILDLDQAAAGNIYSHPHLGEGGGNSWRPDRLLRGWLPAISEAYSDSLMEQEEHNKQEAARREEKFQEIAKKLLSWHGLVIDDEHLPEATTALGPFLRYQRYSHTRESLTSMLAERGFQVIDGYVVPKESQS